MLNGQSTGDDAVGFFCAEINLNRIKDPDLVYHSSGFSVTDTVFSIKRRSEMFNIYGKDNKADFAK